ncbi:MAG: hypothetical protein NC548_25170 [Lachnospiraceae bacterium]|nr:hypothetical protein [Lachnospiraceae bacterium]
MDDKELREFMEEVNRMMSKAEIILWNALKTVRESLKGKPLKNLTSQHLRYSRLVSYICDHLMEINEETTTLEALDMAEDILGKVYATLYTMPRKCKYETHMWKERRKRYLGSPEATWFYGFFLDETGVQVSLDDLFVRLAEEYCMSRKEPYGMEMREFDTVIWRKGSERVRGAYMMFKQEYANKVLRDLYKKPYCDGCKNYTGTSCDLCKQKEYVESEYGDVMC